VRQFSDEHRAKLRAAKLANPVKYWAGKTRPSPSVETRAKMSASITGMTYHTEESKAKLRAAFVGKSRSEEVKRKMREGWQRSELRHQPKGRSPKYPSCFPYKGLLFRSSWEVRVAKALDALGVRWEYERTRFLLGLKTYTPDFYLPDGDCYWEVKGWRGPRTEKTLALFYEQFQGVRLLLINEDAMLALERAAFEKTA
jgi:hypothetical protein